MHRMRLLIDGYNLLHVTDLFGTGKAVGTLQGSREALLTYLAGALSAGERRATTIVFDAAGAPPGLPKTVHHDHITVRYAREYADADALLEEIIERHRAPRGLLVVSSDHRVQRAARRRGSKYIDSNPWYRGLLAKHSAAGHKVTERTVTGGSVDYWVGQFSSDETQQLEDELRKAEAGRARPDTTRQELRGSPPTDEVLENPFPPGYAEELLEDQ